MCRTFPDWFYRNAIKGSQVGHGKAEPMNILLELSGVRCPDNMWEEGCEREGDVSISNILVTYLVFRSLCLPGSWCILGKFITRTSHQAFPNHTGSQIQAQDGEGHEINWGRGSMAAVWSQKTHSSQSPCEESPYWIGSGRTHDFHKQRIWKLWLVLQVPCASVVPATNKHIWTTSIPSFRAAMGVTLNLSKYSEDPAIRGNGLRPLKRVLLSLCPLPFSWSYGYLFVWLDTEWNHRPMKGDQVQLTGVVCL